MSKTTSSVIQINGSNYNAATGEVIGAVKKSATQLRSSATGVVDGFIRPASAAKHIARPHASAASKRVKTTAQTIHKSAQKSRTLMRSAVKPPTSVTRHTDIQRSHPADSPARNVVHADVKPLPAVAKDEKVKRFGHISAKPPATAHVRRQAPVRANSVAAQSAVAPPLPSLVTSASHRQLERMLDQALTTADAHKQSLKNNRRSYRLTRRLRLMPKWLSLGGGLGLLALISVFVAWQRIPQVAMAVASARSHVAAAIPGYTPSGFNFSTPIKYSDGSVTLQFQSKAGGSSYQLTQQKSDWDSSSLASNVFSSHTEVQTSQIGGTTVYIYGNHNNAAWVDHGIRYTINDQANLNSDQILKIADSL